MSTFVFAPPVNGVQTAQGAAWIAPPGVTLAQAWPGGVTYWVDVTDLGYVPAPGSTYANDTWTAPVAASPSPTYAQQAAVLQANGVALTSTGTPALNATYGVDATSQAAMTAEMVSILANQKFTNGTTSLQWLYSTPSVAFTSTAQFTAVATALAAVVTSLANYAAVGGEAPSMTVTIA